MTKWDNEKMIKFRKWDREQMRYCQNAKIRKWGNENEKIRKLEIEMMRKEKICQWENEWRNEEMRK